MMCAALGTVIKNQNQKWNANLYAFHTIYIRPGSVFHRDEFQSEFEGPEKFIFGRGWIFEKFGSMATMHYETPQLLDSNR